jgi:hypothetical protein
MTATTQALEEAEEAMEQFCAAQDRPRSPRPPRPAEARVEPQAEAPGDNAPPRRRRR